MFHAPASETRTRPDQGRAAPRARQRAAGADVDRGGVDPAAAAAGNQAMLRRLGGGEAATELRPSRSAVLQRTCACGGEAGTLGDCAQCRAARVSTGKHRCDAGEECAEDEPARHRTHLGAVDCNKDTGKMIKSVAKEHCMGDCVSQHEDQHVIDASDCCSRVAVCIKNAPAGEGQACRDKFDDYWNTTDSFTECNAYTREEKCLTALLQTCGFPDQDADKEACCQDLVKQHDFVKAQMAHYCPGVFAPCPFP
jgi:hypothetical protein